MEQQVTIAEFSDFNQAHIARSKLESEGIPCVLFNSGLNVFGGHSLLDRIVLRVPKEAKEHAIAVLADLDFGNRTYI